MTYSTAFCQFPYIDSTGSVHLCFVRNTIHVRSELLTTSSVKMTVFLGVMLCG